MEFAVIFLYAVIAQCHNASGQSIGCQALRVHIYIVTSIQACVRK